VSIFLNLPAPPAQPVQLNVYPVKSLLHLFLWGELLGIARLFNRDEIFVAFISSGLNISKNSVEDLTTALNLNI
jgi:hypothetical protein